MATSKPGAWLLPMQQRLADGQYCDMIVRVSVEQPPAKHPRVDDSVALGNGRPRAQQERAVDIPCYAAILIARSRYFEAALSGTYIENQQRMVEIVLADAQAVDDMRLLIKLSCGLSYIQEGGERLPKTTLMRLAFLGNAFEFMDCVQECLQSLSEEKVILEDAFTMVDKMSEELWEHEAAMARRGKMMKVLKEETEGLSSQLRQAGADPDARAAVAVLMNRVTKALVGIINQLDPRGLRGPAEEHRKQTLKEAGEALGKALGPVTGLFKEGAVRRGDPGSFKSAFYMVLSLRTDIKVLSPTVMEVLLGSETLQLRSENDAYYFLCAWLSQSPNLSGEKKVRKKEERKEEHKKKKEEEKKEGESKDMEMVVVEGDDNDRKALFKKLLLQLRFHHMSHDFLCAVVSACPYAKTCGLFSYILHCSHALRTAPRAMAKTRGIDVGRKDRSGGNLECKIKSKFSLADLLPLKKRPSEPVGVYKYLGLAAGFPVTVQFNHEAEGTVGVYARIGLPPRRIFDVEGDIKPCAGFKSSLRSGDFVREGDHFFEAGESWGFRDLFSKPWKEIVCPESPFFSNGALAVELTMEPIMLRSDEDVNAIGTSAGPFATSSTGPFTTAAILKPGAWLATRQQRSLEDRDCDVVVRVSINKSPAEVLRTDGGIAQTDVGITPPPPAQQQQHIIDIPCHSHILISRSRYFATALDGTSLEDQQRTVEIVLSDEQAINDFKLLIKLSCGSSYVQNGDVPLSRSTRLHLAFLGNAFEFVDCVQECLQSLSEESDMTLQGALGLLDEMPEELWELEAAMAVRCKIIKVLTAKVEEQVKQSKEDGAGAEGEAAAAALTSELTKTLVGVIDELSPRKMQGETAEEQKRQALKQAGEALSTILGLVGELFEEGTKKKIVPQLSKSLYYKVLPLRADVKGFSPMVMEVLLGSETLQLRSENNAYYLLCAWLSQSGCVSDESVRRALLKRLLPQLRFYHMSCDFLCAVVSSCPYARASGLLPYILCRSHLMRMTPHSLAEGKGVKKDRTIDKLKYVIKSTINLADLLLLRKAPAKPMRVHKHVGLAFGFPIAVYVEHDDEGTLGIYLDVSMLRLPDYHAEGVIERRVGLAFSLKAGMTTQTGDHFFDGETSWGWSDFFDKSWTEVVHPESPYFPEGVLAVELTLEPITKEDEEREEEEDASFGYFSSSSSGDDDNDEGGY